ncbi:hypothetical protein ABKN59_011794 [Abortiporus biennis]
MVRESDCEHLFGAENKLNIVYKNIYSFMRTLLEQNRQPLEDSLANGYKAAASVPGKNCTITLGLSHRMCQVGIGFDSTNISEMDSLMVQSTVLGLKFDCSRIKKYFRLISVQSQQSTISTLEVPGITHRRDSRPHFRTVIKFTDS